MTTYTVDAQTLSLQQAALERVRAMQRRSVIAAVPPPPPEPVPQPPVPPEPPAATPAPQPPPAEPAPQPRAQRRAPNGLGSLFSPFLRRPGQSGDSLSALGDGVRGAIGSAAQPIGQLLDGFGIGGEELMILLIMYAVFRERGDTTLLMALGYLLL